MADSTEMIKRVPGRDFAHPKFIGKPVHLPRYVVNPQYPDNT